MANPVITNISLISRFAHLAVESAVVIDGASISADGVLPRGTLLCRASVGGKYHAYVHGTDTVAVDMVRILKDDLKVEAAKDAFGVGYLEGFFSLSQLLDANAAGSLVAGDLLVAAGFHKIESDEIRLK